jgi:ComF family protein
MRIFAASSKLRGGRFGFSMIDAILTLAFPQVCVMCGRSVERRRFGVVCEGCWEGTRIFTDDEQTDLVHAIGPYEGALRESVLFLKRQPHVPLHVENLLVAAAQRVPLNASTRVIPVPLHQQRQQARGFNQASVLAHLVARRLRLPLDEASLVRVLTTEKYRAGLDAKGRQQTVAGAFEVRHPRLVANEQILLVDDVFTTGATVSACTEALSQAGAKAIFVLTLARARHSWR